MEKTELKKNKDGEHILEIIVIVMLGITALFTAWATWIGSLHGGEQATSYTKSNNVASEGNSEYNAAVQTMMQDMLLWSDVSDMQIDLIAADNNGDDVTYGEVASKVFYKLNDNLSDEMAAMIGWDWAYMEMDPVEAVSDWMTKEEALVSPFADQEYVDSYFIKANELLTYSNELLESGKESNANGDAYGLVTVIYSVVLFLLGIAGSFKSLKNRMVIVIISVAAFVFATIYMLTIPMPNEFALGSFFGG